MKKGSFPKLITVPQDKETADEVFAGKQVDERDYAFHVNYGHVWITNGRGLISRLWLDYTVGIFLYRDLDLNYTDDGSVTLYPDWLKPKREHEDDVDDKADHKQQKV